MLIFLGLDYLCELYNQMSYLVPCLLYKENYMNQGALAAHLASTPPPSPAAWPPPHLTLSLSVLMPPSLSFSSLLFSSLLHTYKNIDSWFLVFLFFPRCHYFGRVCVYLDDQPITLASVPFDLLNLTFSVGRILKIPFSPRVQDSTGM